MVGGLFGGGSGGGGKQTSTTESSYPEEFRPLASSAVKEIQSLQNARPLASFAPFQPAGVAGLSPFDQWTMDLVTRTPDLPAAFEGLMQLPQPVGASARGAVGAGQQTPASRESLDWLRRFLAGGLTVPEPALAGIPAPAAWSMPAPGSWPVSAAPEMVFPSFAPLARPETAFGAPMPSASSLITQPAPYAQPIPSAPTAPAPSLAAPSFGSAAPGPSSALAVAFPEYAAAEQLSAMHGGVPIITRDQAIQRGFSVDGAGRAFMPQEFGTSAQPVAVVIMSPVVASSFNESPGGA